MLPLELECQREALVSPPTLAQAPPQVCHWSHSDLAISCERLSAAGPLRLKNLQPAGLLMNRSTSTCGPWRKSNAAPWLDHQFRKGLRRPCRNAQTHWQIARAFQDCDAASAVAWKNPIRRSTFRRTN